MKKIKYILPLLLALFIASCTSDDDDDEIVDETAGLVNVMNISNETHTVEIYTVDGELTQGYNGIFLRIKDVATDALVENATLTWNPVMHMTDKMHSCPKSTVSKAPGFSTLYEGYIIFQMPENASEGWTLTVNYSIADVDYTITSDISVLASDKKRVSVFMGSDETKYVVALISPITPEVATNDFIVSIHKMESMMSFPVVENFKIVHDPRMPSMGNHSSPSNTDLIYDAALKMNVGGLSLTMTGYWKLNLMVYNTSNELIKGEAVTDENDSSSLYFELEF